MAGSQQNFYIMHVGNYKIFNVSDISVILLFSCTHIYRCNLQTIIAIVLLYFARKLRQGIRDLNAKEFLF